MRVPFVCKFIWEVSFYASIQLPGNRADGKALFEIRGPLRLFPHHLRHDAPGPGADTLASVIRADGIPKYAMGAMLAGAVLNIIGDPVAIFVLDMGIKGAAYATILGQFVSFLICAAYLTRSRSFRISRASFRPDPALVKQIMALGASSSLTQLSIVVITVVNNILLVKYGAASPYGADIPLAAFVVIMKLFQIVLNIAIGIAAPVFWGVTGIFWAAPMADVLAFAVTAAVMTRLWKRLKAEGGLQARLCPAL